MKPIIGIIGRCQNNDGYSLIGVTDILRNAVIKVGGIPLLILPTQIAEYDNIKANEIIDMSAIEKNDLIRQLKLCNGLISPGGTKEFYYDKFIIEYATKKNIPILGICLGMQLMSCYDNDCKLEENDTNEINHNQRNKLYVHKINTIKGTILNDILGDEVSVNSRHNEHITNPSNYSISAISTDNLIEGIENPSNTFNVGVQWHPESMIDYDEKEFNLLKKFIEISKKNN